MKQNDLMRTIFASIGLAIGLSFTLKYTGIALLSFIGNSHQLLAVIVLATIIATGTLMNQRRRARG